MAKVLITDTNLSNIASAIRYKNGLSSTYTPSQMSQAIRDLVTINDVDTVTYYVGSTYKWFGK